MEKNRKQKAFDVRKKNRRKVIRTVLQAFVLFVAGWMVVTTLFIGNSYTEPERREWTNDDGFIALSYFGVGRTATAKLIDRKLLEEHLQTLHDLGYETISQQDIVQFYHQDERLPEKALFLSFEDGRNDSVLFSEKILEKLNYKATLLTYADKMGNSERKFIQPKQLRKMIDSGYWELGSNGYRLSYINIFDNDGQYVGVRDDRDLKNLDIANIAYYNHYLMDFIRDEHMVPLENRDELFARIDEDYERMEQVYIDSFGYVPDLYMIMHANTLFNGMNPLVEESNARNIERLFNIHFNREGLAYNRADEHIYNLTRLQVAPYWYTNHLLMKLQDETGERVEFLRGDESRASAWEELNEGKAQFVDDRIILTSPPDGAGIIYLKQSEQHSNVSIETSIAGNVVGKQAIYLRYHPEHDEYVRVVLHDNRLIVEQKLNGQSLEQLYEERLDDPDWHSDDLAFNKASIYSLEQVVSGAERAYEDGSYPINIQHTRSFDIQLQGQNLVIGVDDHEPVELQVNERLSSGGIGLYSAYSEENEKDNIYDAVFERFIVSANVDGEQQSIYEGNVTFLEAVGRTVKRQFDAVIDWVLDTF